MFKPQYKQLINVDGIELKPSGMHKSRSITIASSSGFSVIASRFPQLLKYDTDKLWHSVLPHSTFLATLLCLASYEQCFTRLLEMLHKHCIMGMLRVLLIYLHSPSGTVRPRDCAYMSVKPLAAMLQPINMYLCSYTRMYVCTYVCMYVLCMHICTHACSYICAYVHAYIHVYIHTCIHTHVHTYIHAYIHPYIAVYV